jgi:hypothetical protein
VGGVTARKAFSSGHAELLEDLDRPGGWLLLLDRIRQSYVDLSDPTYLDFEYVQTFADVIDALPDGPLAVTHVGGGAATLARYVAATRPGSPQIVLEPDEALTALVRKEIPLPRRHRIRIRPVDGLTGVRALGDASADVVVTDAYAVGRVPAELASAAYMLEVSRVLKPAGMALWNLADEPGMRYVARVLATVRQSLPHLALIATHEVLKGKRFGNSVVVASCAPLPLESLRREVARAHLPTGLREGVALERLIAGAKPFDAQGMQSPPPPEAGRWRAR